MKMANIEQDRYDFVKDRDGEEEARNWALRSYRIYRAWLYGKNAIKNPDYRKPALCSALALRQLIGLSNGSN